LLDDFRGVTEKMTIAQKRFLGRCWVMRAKDLKMDADANEIPFGLSSSIQTSNISRVLNLCSAPKRAADGESASAGSSIMLRSAVEGFHSDRGTGRRR